MRKLQLVFSMLLTGILTQAQSWSATNLTNVTYLAITGSESHQDHLYATVFNGFTGTLYRLSDNNSSWDALTTESITVPRFLKSAGNRMYMSSVVSGISSLIYYSDDDCATFVVDTVGLPPYFGSISLVYGLQYFDGKMIANLGSAGYYLKDITETAWHAIPVPTMLNGGVDPIVGLDHMLFAYDNTGTHTLYSSTDYGTTWNAMTTNLPSDYGTNKLIANETTGRLYSAGTWNNSTEYGIYYSDDLGNTWTLSSEATSFIGTNAGGNLQQVTAMYAHDDTFYMALENDADASSPDIVGTTNGLTNLAIDVSGLPTNASSAINGSQFVLFGDVLALQLNTTDIYLKGGVSSIIENKSKEESAVAYPNPFNEQIGFKTNFSNTISSVQIFNQFGKLVLDRRYDGHNINTSDLNSGVYMVKMNMNDQTTIYQKMIK